MVMLLRLLAGLTLISTGVVGLVLPIIPGIPFLLIGMALLGRDHPLVRRVRRLPLMRPVFERVDRWQKGWSGRVPPAQKSNEE